MYISYKYRIYPNKEQATLIEKHFGCTRYIYNWSLSDRIAFYQSEKKTKKKFDIINELPELKKQNEWLKEVNSQSLQSAVEHMDTAFKNFFRDKKWFPNYHKKHWRQSFHIPQNTWVYFDEWIVSVPKLKWIKTVFHRRFEGSIRQSTISKTPTWKYFISILVEEDIKKLTRNDNTIWIDVGIKDFAVFSTWEKIDNPKYLKKSLLSLKKKQKALSRKVKWSSNRNKARLRVARIHEKVSNQRSDFLHKVSTRVMNENQVICTEDLNVKWMMKNRRLSQAIWDVGWWMFFNMLQYKSEWYGRDIIKIWRFEPSSKTCTCGFINNELTLSMREWTCPKCGNHHDRDILAANNIKRFALAKVGMTWCNACGDEKLFSSVKQEATSL